MTEQKVHCVDCRRLCFVLTKWGTQWIGFASRMNAVSWAFAGYGYRCDGCHDKHLKEVRK